MKLLLTIITLNFTQFYLADWFGNITCQQVESFILCLFAWRWLKHNIKGQSIFALLTMHFIFIACLDPFITYLPNSLFLSYNLILLSLGVYLTRKQYEYKSDKVNKKNICLVFYKPKSLHQTIISLFSAPVASFGMIRGSSLYQLRHGKSKIQKLGYNVKDVERKYIVIDTGYPNYTVTKKDLDELLLKKARQAKTLWLRYNCLRDFKHILNKLTGYEYNGEILPTFYLRKIRWRIQC